MGIITTGVAPASSVIAQSTPTVNPSVRPDGGVAQAIAQNQVLAGQAGAASVSLSGKTRTTSHGPSRSVDGAFEKDGIKKDKEEKDGETTGRPAKKVDMKV